MKVRIVNPTREAYVGRVGTVVKESTRDGRPYLGVEFDDVAHVVWFFDVETVEVGSVIERDLPEPVGGVRLA